jgi:PleD family two-component response regulator
MSLPTLGECANADNQSAKYALAPIDHRRAWGRAMARIVIVEDEIQVLMLAESVLQQAGHDTVSASTVAEAQALINSKDEKFDLVFADVELGGGVLALV